MNSRTLHGVGNCIPPLRLCVFALIQTVLISSTTFAQPGTAFRQLCGEKATAANDAKTMMVVGNDGWMFLASELRHVSVGEFTGKAAQSVSKATKPGWRDPLPAIVDFNKGLENAGVKLLFVPVPPKAIVYPNKVDSDHTEAQRLDVAHQQFYGTLRDAGVTVLDLYPLFKEASKSAASTSGEEPYCKQDSHWSGTGCEIAALAIKKHLDESKLLNFKTDNPFAAESREIELTGDLWSAAQDAKPAKEKLKLRFVGKKNGGTLEPVAPDKTSPVILLGDSHTLVFHSGDDMHARGAGLADQLALELGFPVDVIGVRGSGATPARINLYRRTRGDRDYLKGKKLLVWCFSAREFTEAKSGWRKVPVK